jgi:predicted CXXCH cytochrome family protein
MAMHKLQCLWPGVLFGIIFAIYSFTLPNLAQAANANQMSQEDCMSCHGNPGAEMTLPSGEKLSLYISPDKFALSVHAPLNIQCQSCHPDITSYPHPELIYETRRELSRAHYLTCERCHINQYEHTIDSMHAIIAEQGNLDAPICTDCHTAHYVQDPDQPRFLVSETCGHCHTDLYQQYANSIHGSALIDEENPDVPVCTDCHGVHNIQDPRTAQFRVESPELCASCHANPELMGKYGLSADVYNLYNLSWHGVDVAVYKSKWPTIWHESAVCTDCHGIHNILSTENPLSSVNPANLLATCQKCHPDVGPNWTGAWTGHNEISLQRTPFVFYTDAFYRYLIPIVLAIMVIYILLQITHALVERGRKSLQ